MDIYKEYFSGIWKDRYVLWSLVNRDLQQKYRRSKLGVLWSVITPTGLALIIGLVYATLFSTDPREFIPLLFAGLNPWNFISNSATIAAVSFMTAESYIKQSSVNAQIFPLRNVLVCFVDLLYSIVAFFIIYLFLQPAFFGPKMLLVIPGLFIMFVFVLSIANIVSVINLNVRDYQPLQTIVLQGLFYVTPVIYSEDMMAARGMDFIFKWNPFYYVLKVVKVPLQGREILNIDIYIIAITMTVVLFAYSVKVIMHAKKTVALKL